jgi:hypothetical protein
MSLVLPDEILAFIFRNVEDDALKTVLSLSIFWRVKLLNDRAMRARLLRYFLSKPKVLTDCCVFQMVGAVHSFVGCDVEHAWSLIVDEESAIVTITNTMYFLALAELTCGKGTIVLDYVTPSWTLIPPLSTTFDLTVGPPNDDERIDGISICEVRAAYQESRDDNAYITLDHAPPPTKLPIACHRIDRPAWTCNRPVRYKKHGLTYVNLTVTVTYGVRGVKLTYVPR